MSECHLPSHKIQLLNKVVIGRGGTTDALEVLGGHIINVYLLQGQPNCGKKSLNNEKIQPNLIPSKIIHI